MPSAWVRNKRKLLLHARYFWRWEMRVTTVLYCSVSPAHPCHSVSGDTPATSIGSFLYRRWLCDVLESCSSLVGSGYVRVQRFAHTNWGVVARTLRVYVSILSSASELLHMRRRKRPRVLKLRTRQFRRSGFSRGVSKL